MLDGSGTRAELADVQQAFERAWRRGASMDGRHVLAGQSTRLRVAGATLADHVSAPFAHLRTPRDSGPLDLSIELWDAEATGVAPPVPIHLDGERWAFDDGEFSVSSDGRVVVHSTHAGLVSLDRDARRLAGWVTTARALPLYERARPLQVLLALCASDRNVHAAHAAFVARERRGVLLVGDSGTGKSTAALCCLQAGFSYLADDWVGIAADAGSISGHSLYSTVTLEPGHAQRFAHMRSATPSATDETDRKALIHLADAFPSRLANTATVCAVAMPRIVDAADTRIRAATKKDVLLTMARNAICGLRPRGGRAALAVSTRLARECPAFWLDIGRDLDQIPQRIDQILAATES